MTLLLVNAPRHGLGRDHIVYYKSVSVQIPRYWNIFFPLFNIELLWVLQTYSNAVFTDINCLKFAVNQKHSQAIFAKPRAKYFLSSTHKTSNSNAQKFSWQKIVLKTAVHSQNYVLTQHNLQWYAYNLLKDTWYSEKGNCALVSEQKEISSMRVACCELGEKKYDQLEILKSNNSVEYYL